MLLFVLAGMAAGAVGTGPDFCAGVDKGSMLRKSYAPTWERGRSPMKSSCLRHNIAGDIWMRQNECQERVFPFKSGTLLLLIVRIDTGALSRRSGRGLIYPLPRYKMAKVLRIIKALYFCI